MFSDWIRSMILYLILSGLAINMSPASQYKKYIQYFSGLVVIVILAKPISYMFHFGSGELDVVIGALAQVSEESQRLLEDEIPRDYAIDYYEAGFCMGMRKELQQFGVQDVDIITNEQGQILQCTVYLGQERETKSMEDEIKKYICDVYNLEEPRIYVVRR